MLPLELSVLHEQAKIITKDQTFQVLTEGRKKHILFSEITDSTPAINRQGEKFQSS